MENKNNTLQNNITKESIFTSLMILMEQKNFKEITITEMAKKAGVSRMAFYRNYTVMEDIIICHLDELLQEYSKQILEFESIDNYESICLYFSYFRKHEKLITNLINSNLNNLLLDRCIKLFNTLCKESVCSKSFSPINKSYVVEFIAGGLYTLLIKWAKNGMKESDEDMATLVCNIINT